MLGKKCWVFEKKQSRKKLCKCKIISSNESLFKFFLIMLLAFRYLFVFHFRCWKIRYFTIPIFFPLYIFWRFQFVHSHFNTNDTTAFYAIVHILHKFEKECFLCTRSKIHNFKNSIYIYNFLFQTNFAC